MQHRLVLFATSVVWPSETNCLSSPLLHFEPDIRDTVNYKEVMKQFNLGPNGGIITSLNLFSTRFDQIMNLLEKREKDHKYVILDTPGQIEVFTWSASGNEPFLND